MICTLQPWVEFVNKRQVFLKFWSKTYSFGFRWSKCWWWWWWCLHSVGFHYTSSIYTLWYFHNPECSTLNTNWICMWLLTLYFTGSQWHTRFSIQSSTPLWAKHFGYESNWFYWSKKSCQGFCFRRKISNNCAAESLAEKIADCCQCHRCPLSIPIAESTNQFQDNNWIHRPDTLADIFVVMIGGCNRRFVVQFWIVFHSDIPTVEPHILGKTFHFVSHLQPQHCPQWLESRKLTK